LESGRFIIRFELLKKELGLFQFFSCLGHYESVCDLLSIQRNRERAQIKAAHHQAPESELLRLRSRIGRLFCKPVIGKTLHGCASILTTL
jgi:hypothetical protein